jgi:xanthine dehydrogenase accessory factor
VKVFEEAAAALRRGERAVMVTVVGQAGSTPRKAGARLLVRADGSIAGTIGGGRLEHLVVQDALRLLGETGPGAPPRTVEYRLSADLAMCCGGVMRLFIEPLDPAPALVIFGAGHVGRALAHAAAALELRTYVVDDNAGLLTRARFPESVAAALVDSFDPRDFLAAVPVEGAFAVITTREHRIDQDLLAALAGRPFAYLGLIGSRTKVEKFRRRLAARGVPPEALARVHMPVGLEIGAQTPEEIAVSILAEVIAVRRAAAATTHVTGRTTHPAPHADPDADADADLDADADAAPDANANANASADAGADADLDADADADTRRYRAAGGDGEP